MYEFIILSLLMRGPTHGYHIAKTLGQLIGPVAKASNGRIYPLLAHLEAAGLIAACPDESPRRAARTYQITDLGRARFRSLATDTDSSPREYQELFGLKVMVFPLLLPEDRLNLLDHYIHYCRTHIMHLQGSCDSAGASADYESAEALELVLQHRLRHWQLELSWAEGLKRIWCGPQPCRALGD